MAPLVLSVSPKGKFLWSSGQALGDCSMSAQWLLGHSVVARQTYLAIARRAFLGMSGVHRVTPLKIILLIFKVNSKFLLVIKKNVVSILLIKLPELNSFFSYYIGIGI